MPEGPEVRRMAEGLDSLLRGTCLYGPFINEASSYYGKGIANAELLAHGAHVDAVVPKGKKIIFYLSLLPPYSGQIWMLSSVLMTGRWGLHTGKYSGITFTVAKTVQCANYIHVNLETLYYDDQRRFGTLEIGSGELVLKDVGPSFMQDEVSIEYFTQVLRNKRLANKPIGDFLLEQKYVSGIGNYLRADILYLAGISPFRSLSLLSDNDIETLYRACLDRFAAAYTANGHTIRSYFTPIGESGAYDPLVYGKNTSPAGNPVIKVTDSKRTIHWDPVVQR